MLSINTLKKSTLMRRNELAYNWENKIPKFINEIKNYKDQNEKEGSKN